MSRPLRSNTAVPKDRDDRRPGMAVIMFASGSERIEKSVPAATAAASACSGESTVTTSGRAMAAENPEAITDNAFSKRSNV